MSTFTSYPQFGNQPGAALARGFGEPGGRAAMAMNTNRMLGMMNNLGYGVDQDAIMASMFPNFRGRQMNPVLAPGQGQPGIPAQGPNIGAPVGPVATTPDMGMNTSPQGRMMQRPTNPVEVMGGAPGAPNGGFAATGGFQGNRESQARRKRKKGQQQNQGQQLPAPQPDILY